MGWIEDLRTSLGDVFMALPIVLAGILFFLGTFTSNIGMLYLFVAHAILVPSILYLCNAQGPFVFIQNGKMAWLELAKWAISVGIFVIFTTSTYVREPNEDASAVDRAMDGVTTALPILAFLNPLKYIVNKLGYEPNPKSTEAPCGVFPPVADSKDSFYNEPSSWIGHIVFFFSFVMTNAYFIYNQPAPSLRQGSDPTMNASRQEKLDERVNNRKTIALTAMLVSTLALFLLLFIRFKFTPCEAGFFIALMPMLLIGWMGFSTFYFIYKRCGVRPTDILGVVQGMIDPELIDNPIVCVGNV